MWRLCSLHPAEYVYVRDSIRQQVDTIPQKSPAAFFDYPMDELLRDHATFVQPAGSGQQPSGVSLQTRVTELESEVARLREQLGKAKGINDTMWETVVQRMVAESREKSKEKDDAGSAMDVDGTSRSSGVGTRKSKRTRV